MKDVPYQSIVGAIMYAMLCTRPDIAFPVGALGRFASNPGRAHWSEAQHCLRYLLATADAVLMFDGYSPSLGPSLTRGYVDTGIIHGYTDSDWAGDLDSQRSTGGFVFILAGAAVSWSSKLQVSVALSSTEAEYMATARATQEALWLRMLLSELGQQEPSPIPMLLCADNQGAIALAKNPGDHPRTKHIAIRYHFTRDAVKHGAIQLQYCPTDEMTADIMTKALGKVKHNLFSSMMGVEL